MIKRNPYLEFGKRRRELMKMTRFLGISLDVVDLVVRSVVQISNPLTEGIFVSVTEWISSKDTVKLNDLDVARSFARMTWQ